MGKKKVAKKKTKEKSKKEAYYGKEEEFEY